MGLLCAYWLACFRVKKDELHLYMSFRDNWKSDLNQTTSSLTTLSGCNPITFEVRRHSRVLCYVCGQRMIESKVERDRTREETESE